MTPISGILQILSVIPLEFATKCTLAQPTLQNPSGKDILLSQTCGVHLFAPPVLHSKEVSSLMGKYLLLWDTRPVQHLGYQFTSHFPKVQVHTIHTLPCLKREDEHLGRMYTDCIGCRFSTRYVGHHATENSQEMGSS